MVIYFHSLGRHSGCIIIRIKQMSDDCAAVGAVNIMFSELGAALARHDLASSSRLCRCITNFGEQDNGLRYVIESKANKKMMASAMALILDWRAGLKAGDYAHLQSPEEHVWYRVKIKDINASIISVHYDNWDAKYDKIMPLDSLQLLPDGALIVHKPPKKIVTVDVPVVPSAAADEPSSISSPDALDLNPKVLSRSGRAIKIREINGSVAGAGAISTPKTMKSPKKRRVFGIGGEDDIEEETDINDWVCGICWKLEAKYGSKLLLCDGPCLRSFHIECLSYVPVSHLPIMHKSFIHAFIHAFIHSCIHLFAD